MKKTRMMVLLTTALVSLGGLHFAGAQSQKQTAPAETTASPEERDRLLVIGKKLFVDRCSKCHDQRGDKPLKTGPPLSERKLSDAEIERLVAGRLKDAPDEQKRAVALYVSRFMKRK